MRLMHIIFACCAVAAPSVSQSLTGQRLAEHLDTVRRPNRSFEVNLKITELRDGKQSRVSEHRVCAKKSAGGADFDILTIVLAPEDDRNKVILTKGLEVWLFDPKSSRPVSIAPRHFRNKFFVADALSTSFAAQYESELVGEETVLDAARKERLCHHLRMKLKGREGLTPETVDYWIEKDTLRVVRGQFYTGSGKLLRTAYYTSYQKLLGEMRPTRIVVVSSVDRGLVTDIVFASLAYRDTPESLFVPEAMPGVSKSGLP